MRRKAVSEKFAFATHFLKGKTVTLVDDSLVRGTTSQGITKALRKRGVKEVHWRIPSPKVVESCFYGIATANRDRLLAVNHDQEQMRQDIDADSLEFLDLPDFQAVLRSFGLPVENGCFTCMTGVPWHKQITA
jgi:amidophosphoribosyltransferase